MSESSKPSVAIVIVNWNAADVIGPCIDSLRRQKFAGRLEIVVVDNASTDGSIAYLEGLGDAITLVASPENLGFGKGNNLGFQAVRTDFVISLNPDTEILQEDGVSRIVSWFADPSIGMVGPHIVNADGSTQPSCSSIPSITNLLAASMALPRLLPDSLRRRYAPVIWSHDRSTDTGWVVGACVALRSRDYLEIGGFSERTFMYGEDLELGYQVRRLGKRVFYDFDTDVLHLGDHSSTQRWSDAETAARTSTGNLVFFYERYSPRVAGFGRLLLKFAYSGRASVLRRLGRVDRAEIYTAMASVLGPGAVSSQQAAQPRSSLTRG